MTRVWFGWWLGLAACATPADLKVNAPEALALAAETNSASAPNVSLTEPLLLATERDARATRETLAVVARAHELEVLRPVANELVSRDRGIALIIEKTNRDVPRAVLDAQGEMLAALELMPSDYPFVDGLFAMVKANIAGFYDPHDHTMYLLDDLDDASRGPTLSHELVHALQDQHFDLGGRLTYRPGEADVLAATSSFAEGDATAAMFAGPDGTASPLSADTLRLSMSMAVAFSATGLSTPPVLQASLVAPYVDGYRFVSALRERGGWAEVNRVWRDPPRSTEQVLHLEKYDAHEAPLVVAPPGFAALGPGWRLLDSDVSGEQALRLALEQWFSPPEAVRAAAGWGGDRYALVGRDVEGGREIALAWHVRFDDAKEAIEAETLLMPKFAPCRVRSPEGPIAVKRKGADLGIVAGPFLRSSAGKALARPDASCKEARRWLDEVLRQP